MKNKILILLFLILNINYSCSQHSKKNTMEKNNLNTIYTHLNETNIQKFIFLNLNYFSCSVEVLINDIPVYTNLNGKYKSGESYGLQINEYILESGVQELTIRIYPISNDKDILENFISKMSKVNVKIKYGEKKDKIQDYLTLIDYQVSSDSIGEIPFFEIKKNFQIEDLPYQLSGWKKSENLKKEDKDKLLDEVLQYYIDYSNNMKNRNIETISNP